MYSPDFETFRKLAEKGNLIPVYREIIADTETPVSALMKLDTDRTFLLESVEGGEKWGRYSFLGTDPRLVFRVRGEYVIIEENGNLSSFRHEGDPLGFLKKILGAYRPVPVPGIPRFYGGAVGYLGYEMIRHFENLPSRAEDDLGTDDAVFVVTDSLAVFDNVRHTIKLVSCVHIDGSDLKTAYESAAQKIESLAERLASPLSSPAGPNGIGSAALTPNMPAESFRSIVDRARQYILQGDAIQVVVSQRFETEKFSSEIDLYRALRYVNPSPYLFYLRLGDLTLIGSSPEVMVRLEEGTAELRPIAGTRRRGATEQEDRRLSNELLDDPKEKAEHVMLVDLGRNDLGRIAETGSVQVTQLMIVEKYSHVMHLVSNIRAQLAAGRDAFDVIRASFPAGTLTGAPKIRAMEIIDELEPVRRGPYGGAVGYFSYTGNMDFCITIRTMLVRNGKIYIQAGAGIVADSNPEAEYSETLSKAEGLAQALRLAASEFRMKAKT
ncbi:MAG TPA: anthranilate synthase component I [Syntrophales bacterium]|nr:anthranilate synthase component I [Syntrophales bacterium]